jgi:hypothetical protein
MKKGEQFLIAIYPEDAAYLKVFPSQSFSFTDTVKPFVLYRYEVK